MSKPSKAALSLYRKLVWVTLDTHGSEPLDACAESLPLAVALAAKKTVAE